VYEKIATNRLADISEFGDSVIFCVISSKRHLLQENIESGDWHVVTIELV
jgi:hypothetical protein